MAKKPEIKKEPVKKAAVKKAEVVTEDVFEPVKQEDVAPVEQKNELSEAEIHDAKRNEWLSKGN